MATATYPIIDLAYPSLRIREIDPELAALWLMRNKHNRPVRERTVLEYAKAMQSGQWMMNGDAIRFDTSDNILDGQHRLMAIVESGVTITSIVISGLQPEVFQTIDRGAKRSIGDMLHVQGETDVNVLGGALGVLWSYEHEGWDSTGGTPSSIADLRGLLERHPGIRDSLYFGRKVFGARLMSPSVAVAMHYIFHCKDAVLADTFFERLGDGVDLDRTSPIRFLRERLMANATSKSKLQRNELKALVVIAWNYTRDNRAMHQLRWRSKGPNAESFPEVK